nr:MAG TPA: hypothetical protein [Caudoviricetes sp.]
MGPLPLYHSPSLIFGQYLILGLSPPYTLLLFCALQK